jgi:peptidylprolyl isomerase/peptidyl-prolyl cis-trans isomerase B (cyclophilin B)
MKRIPIILLVLFAFVTAFDPGHAAPTSLLGPEVAVFEVRFGKEKESARFVLGLYDSAAPQTVSNFKALVGRKFYNGMRFHRVFPDLLIQTGDPKSRRGPSETSGTGGPGFTIPAEIELPLKKGAVVTARLPDKTNPARASNGSQFFIALREMPDLNGKYTVFGEVLEGWDVLERISRTRADSNDFPVEKIVIRRVRIEPRFTPASPANQ